MTFISSYAGKKSFFFFKVRMSLMMAGNEPRQARWSELHLFRAWKPSHACGGRRLLAGTAKHVMIAVPSVFPQWNFHPSPTVSEGVEEKTDFTRIMAAWFNRSVTPAGNSLPAYSFFSTLSFIFPRFSSRFLIAHPRRVKALSSSDTKKKLTGTAANPAASS